MESHVARCSRKFMSAGGGPLLKQDDSGINVATDLAFISALSRPRDNGERQNSELIDREAYEEEIRLRRESAKFMTHGAGKRTLHNLYLGIAKYPRSKKLKLDS